MGTRKVKASGKKSLQQFEHHLLQDLYALESMLEQGLFEIDNIRIGAEQEVCLLNEHFKPSPNNLEILEAAANPYFTTELAKFNVEINVPPLLFKADCLSKTENFLVSSINELKEIANGFDTQILLAGIAPSIRKSDLESDNITPIERYFALCKAITKLRGSSFDLSIQGSDELMIHHDSPLLEAANTGFQVHLQVRPADFVSMYNISQAITGPVLAAAANSPLLFRKRLWRETRVALFQQSVDTRRSSSHLRESSPRVTFGNKWLQKNILEIYKEDIVRYRVLLDSEAEENVQEILAEGKIPQLHALRIHNSSVYRWNRPCYGISDGKAHLRIENRIFPSGPSVVDEMANAAFWLGLMNAFQANKTDVTKQMDFSDAQANFLSAARSGLDTKFIWFKNKRFSASDLILNELLPLAQEGLKKAKINTADSDRYLGVMEERVKSHITGSIWTLRNYNSLLKIASEEEAVTALTASMIKQQKNNKPVHKWKNAGIDDNPYFEASALLVEECMSKDLFTVRKNDIVALAAEMMLWQHIRYVAVENDKGELEGLLTSRTVLKEFSEVINQKKKLAKEVSEIMIYDPITISPSAKLTEAAALMEQKGYGCLPVVKNKKLVGMLTEQDFTLLTKRLLRRIDK